MSDTQQTQIPKASEMMMADKWAEGDQLSFKAVDYYTVEFAKLHVKAALEAAANNAGLIWQDTEKRKGYGSPLPDEKMKEYGGREGYNEDSIRIIPDKDSILNAYPLDKIK